MPRRPAHAAQRTNRAAQALQRSNEVGGGDDAAHRARGRVVERRRGDALLVERMEGLPHGEVHVQQHGLSGAQTLFGQILDPGFKISDQGGGMFVHG